MSVRKRAVALAVGVFQLASAAGAGDGEPTAQRTRWGCNVAEQHLVCWLERSAEPPAAPMLPPLDPRLPTIVRELRQRPALWRGRTLRIPLHTEPFPDSPLRELAQAVLCGVQSDCEAVVGADRWSNETAWLDFADANDPLLQRYD